MTIDEAINDFKKMAQNARSEIIDGCNLEPQEKHYNSQLELYAKEKEQISEWLEELKATKSSDIPIIHGKEELELHDKAIRNKAIDDLMEKVSECFITDEDWDYLLQESEKLKDGVKNEQILL